MANVAHLVMIDHFPGSFIVTIGTSPRARISWVGCTREFLVEHLVMIWPIQIVHPTLKVFKTLPLNGIAIIIARKGIHFGDFLIKFLLLFFFFQAISSI